MSRIFDQSENNSVVKQVTPLSLSTCISCCCCCCCCSSDPISGDEYQLDTQQQLPHSLSFHPNPVETLLPSLLNEEKPLLLALGSEYYSKLESQSAVAVSRADSIVWILKVTAFNRFQPLTAYMSISYLDRFLSARQLPSNTNGWPYQLLSVACLSLAAKVEEVMVPSLVELQMEGVVAKQIFEPKTVQRMELLVLSVLEWRLRSVTPFEFLTVFAYKVDPTGEWHGYLTAQASDIILASVSDARILQYMPSCIAAAALSFVARKIQGVCKYIDLEFAKSWSADGLSRESIIGCCGILHDIISIRFQKSIGTFTELRSSSPSSIESSSCSSSSSSSPCKRRRLNKNLWV